MADWRNTEGGPPGVRNAGGAGFEHRREVAECATKSG
jgi:hypothetical protein